MTGRLDQSQSVSAPRKGGRQWQLLLVIGGVVVLTAAVLWWSSVAFPTSVPTTIATHSHPEVGEPGNPQLPARTVEVAMVEGDGTMKFEPSVIEVARGDQVRFKITNTGALSHEFILSTLTDNLQHLEEMKRMPAMIHSGANSITLQANTSGEIFWHFTQAGSFDFSCLIPGHREAGMHGAVIVK